MGAEEGKTGVCDTEDKGDSRDHTGPVPQSSSPGGQGTAAFTPRVLWAGPGTQATWAGQQRKPVGHETRVPGGDRGHGPERTRC